MICYLLVAIAIRVRVFLVAIAIRVRVFLVAIVVPLPWQYWYSVPCH